MKRIVGMLALALALTGCGAPRHIGSVLAPIPQAAGAQGESPLALAERAVRQQLEKQVPDFWVSLQALVVMAPATGSTYTFAAYETISGLGGQTRYKIDGTCDVQHLAVKVLHKTAI